MKGAIQNDLKETVEEDGWKVENKRRKKWKGKESDRRELEENKDDHDNSRAPS